MGVLQDHDPDIKIESRELYQTILAVVAVEEDSEFEYSESELRALADTLMHQKERREICYMEEAVVARKIEYFHASKYGNGAAVAEEFRKHLAAKGATVNVHHIRDVRPREMPPGDLYLFSSPGRCGKPTWGVRRFLRKVQLPAGTKYAILTTEMPTPEDRAKWQRLIPVMNEILQEKGLIKVAEGKVIVTGLKGPLEDGWQNKVQAFASQLLEPLSE